MRGIRIDVPESDVELVSDVLWSLGATAVTEDWIDDQRVILRTSFGSDSSSIESILTERLPGVHWEHEEIDTDVAETWKQFAVPTPITENLWIRPAWDRSPIRPDAVVVTIDPGATFGMGDHPTTRGCLQLLADSVDADETILDVGCGSGVLGITALVLGAQEAIGVDITPACLETSRENAVRNGVGDQWSVTTESLSSMDRGRRTVVANILAPVLIELADDIVRLATDRIVLSGLLDGREAHVVQAMAPFVERRRVVVEGWVSIELVRTSRSS